MSYPLFLFRIQSLILKKTLKMHIAILPSVLMVRSGTMRLGTSIMEPVTTTLRLVCG